MTEASRLLGFLTGVSVLGALWFNAWSFKTLASGHFAALLILGFRPTMIILGRFDARLGMGELAVDFGDAGSRDDVAGRGDLPGTRNIIVIAALAANAGSVQSIYDTTPCCCSPSARGGVAVAFRRGVPGERAAAVLGIGFVSAVSGCCRMWGLSERGAARMHYPSCILRRVSRFLTRLDGCDPDPGDNDS